MVCSHKQCSGQGIYVLNGSVSCEPSGYLFGNVVMFLKANGYDLRYRGINSCDTILINTCCVTASKIIETEKLIDNALQWHHIRKLVIFGCYSKINKMYSAQKEVYKIGPKELWKFNRCFRHHIPIEDVRTNILKEQSFIPYQENMTCKDCYILISQGCIHNCSYCNIKLAKGHVLSRDISDIVAEIKDKLRSGYHEFTLLSDDCGSYGHDKRSDLVGLLEDALSIDPRIRLKISTIFPGDFIRLYPRLKKLLKTQRITYINLPIQSGSDRILKLMNRNYKKQAILDRVKDIKRISPGTWLYSHILMNFPSETKQDFKQSLRAATFFDELMFITYSNNPLTLANSLKPQVNRIDQAERIQIAKNFVNFMQKGIVVEKT